VFVYDRSGVEPEEVNEEVWFADSMAFRSSISVWMNGRRAKPYKYGVQRITGHRSPVTPEDTYSFLMAA